MEALLPPDNITQGFDNMSEAPIVTPTLMDAYVGAAGKIARLAVGDPGVSPTVDMYRVPTNFSQNRHVEGVLVYTYIHYAFAGQTAHVVALYAPFLTVAVAVGAPPLLAALLLCFFSNLNSTLTHYGDGAAPIYYGSRYIEQPDCG